jgi:hypothetical protein
MFKKLYLVTYNLAAMVGWGVVLLTVVQSYLNNFTPAQLWTAGTVLQYNQ